MICAFCKSEISDEAIKCPHCAEYTDGNLCPKCCSSIPKGAFICKFCGTSQPNRVISTQEQENLAFSCKILPSFLFRGRLIPQEILTDLDKVVIKAPGFFWLWCDQVEIPWNKVAGFSYRSGIFWDMIEIETRGQKPSHIVGLSKYDGQKIRSILQQLEK